MLLLLLLRVVVVCADGLLLLLLLLMLRLRVWGMPERVELVCVRGAWGTRDKRERAVPTTRTERRATGSSAGARQAERAPSTIAPSSPRLHLSQAPHVGT